MHISSEYFGHMIDSRFKRRRVVLGIGTEHFRNQTHRFGLVFIVLIVKARYEYSMNLSRENGCARAIQLSHLADAW